MKTLILDGQNKNDRERAGRILQEGGLVAIPTETVYGLAGNALDGAVVEKIYAAKGRPSDNPLIVHISDFSQLASLVRAVPESAKKLAKAFWPGPLTMILPKSNLIPRETSGGLDTVAVRFPSHPVARAVIEEAGVPLAAPSANLSGRPSPTTFAHVQEDLSGRVDALLDGGDCGVGVESTVITLAENPPRMLRPGGITLEELREVLPRVEVDDAVTHRLEEGASAASPGMKYKHYSPRAEVLLVDASPDGYENYVNSKGDCHGLCFDENLPRMKVPAISYGSRYDSRAQAHRLFTALHALDEQGARQVYASMPGKCGLGLAVYNRMIRSAAFRVVRPEHCMIVGLVGPSGSGKSTVGLAFADLGAAVIDCDRLTRSDQVYDMACVQELAEAFGQDIMLTDGGFDRRLVAKRAFSSPAGKSRLQEITFPRIGRAVREQIDEARKQGKRVILLDAPTLFEAGMDRICARILCVCAPEEVRIARIIERDGISREAALQRLSAQHEPEFYEARSDYRIENGAHFPLRESVAEILEDLQGEKENL